MLINTNFYLSSVSELLLGVSIGESWKLLLFVMINVAESLFPILLLSPMLVSSNDSNVSSFCRVKPAISLRISSSSGSGLNSILQALVKLSHHLWLLWQQWKHDTWPWWPHLSHSSSDSHLKLCVAPGCFNLISNVSLYFSYQRKW